jgi:Caspase domain
VEATAAGKVGAVGGDNERDLLREFNPEGLGFDAENSTALLIGGDGHPFYPELEPLPEARNSVLALAACLADRKLVGFGNVIPIIDQGYPQVVEMLYQHCEFLREREKARNDCLLVYFAGHGLIDDDDTALLLATRSTHWKYPHDSALSVASLKRMMASCKVGVSILMLDCCYAAKAVNERFPDNALKSLDSVARYVVCSSGPRQRSRVPANGQYTGFTGELLAAMKEGLKDRGATVPFSALIMTTAKRCVDLGLPEPWLNFAGKAAQGSDFEFIRNAAFQQKSVFSRIEDDILPLLDDESDKRRIQKAIKEDRKRASVVASYVQLDQKLYEIVSELGHEATKLDVVKAMIALPSFREFFNTSKQIPSWQLKRESSIMRVSKAGNTECEWVRRVTTSKPLSSVWAFMTGDEGFSGFDPLKCRFKVSYSDPVGDQAAGPRVVSIPLLDEQKRKEFVLYVYPAIPVGVTVDILVEYSWPKLFAPLIEQRMDYWEFQIATSADHVPEVVTIFELPVSIGQLNVTCKGSSLKGQIACSQQEDRQTVEYKLTQVQNGTNVKLNLTLSEPPKSGGAA